MRTPVGIVVLAVAAFAVAGCGASERHGPQAASAGAPLSQPAPDAQRAQDLVALTTGQAARQAQRIALVVAGSSRVIEGAPGTPFTRTTFAVQQVLKGRLPRRFVLQVIGGRLGDRMVASPVPAFATSSRYLLFLGPDGPAGPTIFPQAVLDVKRAAGAAVVAPAPSGIRLLGAGSASPARALDAGPRLEDVLFSIRRYLRITGGTR